MDDRQEAGSAAGSGVGAGRWARAHDGRGMAWHGGGIMRCHGVMGGWGMVSQAAWPQRG